MTAVLVSAKVSVFYSMIKKTFPKFSQRFYLAQTLIKDKKHKKQRLDKLLITKHEQKSRNKNKIGLPPNKRYRLTPLARHDYFNDAHIKDELKHKESIIKNMTSTFKSNPLPMHRDFVSKELVGTRINLHRKAKQG